MVRKCHRQPSKVSRHTFIRSVRVSFLGILFLRNTKSSRALGFGFPGTESETDTPNLDLDAADSGVESDDNAVEDTSLLEMDAHIIPLEQLVERFNSDLTKGLSDDTVTQHRATFGQNKLTPSRPPSLLWMFIKQMLMGFNGILWLATLFAFLSYVSSLLCFLFEKKIDGRINLKYSKSFVFVETVR